MHLEQLVRVAGVVALSAMMCAGACGQAQSVAQVGGQPGGEAAAGSPEAVIARARDVLGIDQFNTYRGVRLTGESTIAGLPLKFEMIFDNKGRFIERFTGAITIASGFDGTTAWSHDIAGEERVLELLDRDRAITNAGVISGWWLFPASGSTFSAGEDATSLRWHGPGNATADLTVDPETGRITKWTARTVLGVMSTSLTGEVRLGKMVFPAKVATNTDGVGEVRILKAEAFDASDKDFAADISRPKDVHFDANVPAELAVTKTRSGHLLVPVTIDGKDAGNFIFDTGAGGTVISTALAEKLGLEKFGELPMVGVGGTIKTSFVRPKSMGLGPVSIDGPLMTTLDTGFLTQAMGTEISGIVGYGLMHRAIIEVDKEGPKVALHDPASFNDPKLKWEEMRVTARVPVCKASLEGHEGWFRLDTGASARFLTVHYAAVRDLKLLEGREVTPTQLGGVGGKVPGKTGKLAWFEIGGRRSENVVVDFATQDVGAFADQAIMGNLGGKALAGFDIFFDYQGRRIAFVQKQ